MEHKQLPEVGQVAIVVKNLEEAITYWSEMLNVGPFKKIEYSPEKSVVRGKNVPIKLKLAFANWGKQNLEIIEVAEGDPQHIEFLEKTGGGVHHLGFYVHDLEQWVDYFEKKRHFRFDGNGGYCWTQRETSSRLFRDFQKWSTLRIYTGSVNKITRILQLTITEERYTS